MRTDRVSFIHSQRRDGDDFRCRETGLTYRLESSRALDCYIVRTFGGRELGTRDHRHEALDLIEQTAALDFASAQAESAWATNDIQLDGTLAV